MGFSEGAASCSGASSMNPGGGRKVFPVGFPSMPISPDPMLAPPEGLAGSAEAYQLAQILTEAMDHTAT